MQANPLILICSFNAAPTPSAGLSRGKQAAPAGGHVSDSDQSSNSVISMSESASDSASDSDRDTVLGSPQESPSRSTVSDPEPDAASSAHLLAEQV